MQSAHAAHQHITATTIYATTGAPVPEDIDQIVSWLLNLDFSEAFNRIHALKVEKSLSLVDVVTLVFAKMSKLEVSAPARIFLVENLASIEYALLI